MELTALCNTIPVRDGLLNKTWKIMRLTTLLLLISALHVSAGSYSQQVTLTVKKIPLQKAFSLIQQQTGYSFFCDLELLEKAPLVSVKLKSVSLKEALDSCMKYTGFAYEIQGKLIYIRAKKETAVSVEDTYTASPLTDIRIKVTGEKGQPLLGAYIKLKGTNRGTVTDEKGMATLKGVNNVEAVLEISFVGYQSQNVTLKGSTSVTVSMKVDINDLGEAGVQVVSTGYQTLPKERATGSFAQPDKDLFEGRISTDVISKLDGITSGLLFNKDPSTGTGLHIRGYSTINANTAPLIVVDNFPYDGDISNINPNDVADVSVLKDAAAASIWGARAGNGVIVITTKKGKFNQPLQVSLTGNVTVSGKPDLSYNRNFLNSNDFIDLEQHLFNLGFYDADLSSPQYPPVSPVVTILAQERAGTLSSGDANNQINNLKNIDVRNDLTHYFYRKQSNQQYNLNMSGGNEKANYMMSVGYDHDLDNTYDSNDRFTVNSIITIRPVKNLQVTGGLNYIQSNVVGGNTISGIATGGQYAKGIYPYAQLADQNGNPLSIVKSYNSYFTQQAAKNGLLNWEYYPLIEKNLMDNTIRSYDTRLNTDVKYTFIPGLSVEGLYQYDRGTSQQRVYYAPASYYVRNLVNLYTDTTTVPFTNNIPNGGILNLYETDYVSDNARLQVNFNKNFKKSSISSIAGVEERQVTGAVNYNNTVYGYDPSKDAYQSVSYGTGYSLYPSGYSTIPNNFLIDHTINRYRSYFANVAYAYNNLYTFSASARIDQTNIFGVKTNDKSVPLWSIGAKWNLSGEPFYHVRWLPLLTPRITYGFSGNLLNNGTAYTTATYSTSNNSLYPSYYLITSPGNPQLTWEKIAITNLGFDFGLIRDILTGSLEYYYKNGTDLIGINSIPSSTGFNSSVINYASMKGHGVDLILNAKNIDRQFQWSSSFLFSYTTDQVTKYTGNNLNGSPVQVGKPVNALYVYKWAGLNPSNGDPQGYLNGTLSTDYSTLIIALIDQKAYAGRLTPSVFGGFRNTLSYKNISLSANISYKFGYYFLRSSINYYNLFNSWQGNVDYAKRWQKPGDEKITSVPSLPKLPPDAARDQFYNYSETLVTNGDHIRLQDISLGYDLNKDLLKKLSLKSLRISLYANNLGLIWKANKYGIDPDFQQSVYTQAKTISVALKAGF